MWKPWQRAVSSRTDVLSYVSEALTASLSLPERQRSTCMAPPPAPTLGGQADREVPAQPEMGGYQLGIAMDIFRTRYRDSLAIPSTIPANTVHRYRFALPNANHVFLPGHRLMVPIQSSWFPLYERNRQTYVANIFHAQPADYQKATRRIYHQPGAAGSIELPIVTTWPAAP